MHAVEVHGAVEAEVGSPLDRNTKEVVFNDMTFALSRKTSFVCVV